jgi:hypothetical protein
MINKDEIFSFTFLFNDENNKVILIKKGQLPARSEKDADQVFTYSNPEDAAVIDGIVSKIQVFRDAEPGNDPSVTEYLEDFQDKYGISLEELEQDLDQDISGEEDMSGLSQQHHEENMREKEKEVDGEYSATILTDPTAILPSALEHFTLPGDFLIDDEPIFIYDYAAEPLEQEKAIEEGNAMGEAVEAFVREVEPTKRYYAKDVRGIFVDLKIYDPIAQLRLLRQLPKTGNISVIKDDEGIPCLVKSPTGTPGKFVTADDAILKQLLNPSGLGHSIN